MSLADTYEKIKQSIVAFTAKYGIAQGPEDINNPKLAFPPIIGTGFIINENGIIVTNDHVAKFLPGLPKPPYAPKGKIPCSVSLLKKVEEGLLHARFEILDIMRIKEYVPKGISYGSEKPDIAIVVVKAKGLPELELCESMSLREGMEIATAGFPMGTQAFTAPGWLHQITPTLQRGIISAVLPYQCPSPHALAINVMAQGGASGSPVFLPENGKVIGILNCGLREFYQLSEEDVPKAKYAVPTNISHVVPSNYILEFLKTVQKDPRAKLPKDTKTFDELIEETPREFVNDPRKPRITITRVDI